MSEPCIEKGIIHYHPGETGDINESISGVFAGVVPGQRIRFGLYVHTIKRVTSDWSHIGIRDGDGTGVTLEVDSVLDPILMV